VSIEGQVSAPFPPEGRVELVSDNATHPSAGRLSAVPVRLEATCWADYQVPYR
jgi:hypothetical protein